MSRFRTYTVKKSLNWRGFSNCMTYWNKKLFYRYSKLIHSQSGQSQTWTLIKTVCCSWKKSLLDIPSYLMQYLMHEKKLVFEISAMKVLDRRGTDDSSRTEPTIHACEFREPHVDVWRIYWHYTQTYLGMRGLYLSSTNTRCQFSMVSGAEHNIFF